MVTNTVRWDLVLDGKPLCIQLFHNTFTGKRRVLINMKEMVSEYNLFDNGSVHQLSFNNKHKLKVCIVAQSTHFSYELSIDDSFIQDEDSYNYDQDSYYHSLQN